MKSLGMVYEDPLYYEAVVTSVTAFETYVRDTLIELISKNKLIEKIIIIIFKGVFQKTG